MFPTVRVSFSGLVRPSKPTDFYAVLLDIVPVDSRRYRYAYHRSAWLVAGNWNYFVFSNEKFKNFFSICSITIYRETIVLLRNSKIWLFSIF